MITVTRSRTAVVDGPSAPAFASIALAIACQASRAALASASSAANTALSAARASVSKVSNAARPAADVLSFSIC